MPLLLLNFLAHDRHKVITPELVLPMGYVPTDIDHAMNTLCLSTLDEQFYMDTSATSHMTSSQGNLMPYFPLKLQLNNAIVIGNGDMIPVHGHRHLSFPSSQKPLTLKNVIHALKLVKNLIFVRQFTHDNSLNLIILDFL